MTEKTILNEAHRAMGARMVPFAGWDMPLHYGSQLDEHHAVRRAAGMFDVSHMLIVDLSGTDARNFLRRLLANDVDKLKTPGKALYGCMLNEDGGVIDDLITYKFDDENFRVVVNAATAAADLEWIERQAAGLGLTIDARRDLSMIAVQGPEARTKALELIPGSLKDEAGTMKPFSSVRDKDWMVARTGYTGEDGFEVMLANSEAVAFWNGLADAGVAPCGLGARDTLRLEAGMNLYGTDMDEGTSPLDAGLAWTLALEPADRDFLGRAAVESHKASGDAKRFVGLVLDGRGVLRNHQALMSGDMEVGEITSGGFSPTLERSIALARLNKDATGDIEVNIRGKRLPVRIIKPPFVRNGEVRIELPA